MLTAVVWPTLAFFEVCLEGGSVVAVWSNNLLASGNRTSEYALVSVSETGVLYNEQMVFTSFA